MYRYKTKYIIRQALFFFTVLAMMFGCSPMDAYKEFVVDGEISYTGKIENVTFHPGYYRVEISGVIKSDPKITKVKMFWNGNLDSAEVAVNRTSSIDTVRFHLENMEENVQSFVLYTYDALGNRSVPASISGRVYGDKYIATLYNRTVFKTEEKTDGVLVIWGKSGFQDGLIGTTISYTNTNEQTISIYTPSSVNLDSTFLANHKAGTPISYFTHYKPDTTAIDVFYAKTERVKILQEVTSTYIKNAGPNFTASSYDGIRWGILDNWIVNEAILNAKGFGGYEKRSGIGLLSVQGGFGLPGVLNGKIHQTFRLNAGSYQFILDMKTNSPNGVKYMVVSEGETLPDFDKVQAQSLVFDDINASKISFTLNEPKTISIGFVCNLPGAGEYFNLNSVRMLELKE